MSSPTGSPTVVALKPARTFPSSNTQHCIRYSCRQGATPAGEDPLAPLALGNVQIHIGTVPKGSVISNIQLHVRTLFNGTTPTFDVGTIANATGLAAAAETLVAAAGLKKNLGVGTQMGFTPTDLPLYVRLAAAGNTAGELHMVVEYYPCKT